ncbi:MAG: lysoplasmalogenase [Algicola sp.]|nr:lysoplasmalogenase [Algicola sp.]
MVARPNKSSLIINILIIISAVLAMVMEYFGSLSAYMVLKPLTTVLVISLLVFIPKLQWTKLRTIMVFALLFCLLGDILLMFPAYFVFGLAAFLVAHMLFVWGFVRLNGFQRNWILFVILFGIGGILFYWLRPGLGEFLVPVGVYVLVICSMAWQGIALFLKEKRKEFIWIAIAVLCFMFSDTMIAISKFRSAFDYSGIVILSTYWISIALIANAVRKIVLKSSE